MKRLGTPGPAARSQIRTPESRSNHGLDSDGDMESAPAEEVEAETRATPQHRLQALHWPPEWPRPVPCWIGDTGRRRSFGAGALTPAAPLPAMTPPAAGPGAATATTRSRRPTRQAPGAPKGPTQPAPGSVAAQHERRCASWPWPCSRRRGLIRQAERRGRSRSCCRFRRRCCRCCQCQCRCRCQGRCRCRYR